MISNRNAQKLLRVVHMLERQQLQIDAGAPCPQFDMGMWMEPRMVHGEYSRLGSIEKFSANGNIYHEMAENVNLCGTACCAIGLAATDKDFKQAGLKIVFASSGHTDSGYSAQGDIMYRGLVGYEAVGLFFGIPTALAKYLFSALTYTPEERRQPGVVARRVKTAVETMQSYVE